MNRQGILAVLQDDLRDAEKQLQDTSEYLDLAIQMNRRPGPTVDTQHRVKLAARAYRRAVDHRSTVLLRLKSVMSNDTLLECLKPAGPADAQNSRFNPEADPN